MLVFRILKELSEDFNSIKKIQSEMKDTLIKITIYRVSTVVWMKSRIKSMIRNVRKQKQPIRTAREKKKPKKEDSVRIFWDNFK